MQCFQLLKSRQFTRDDEPKSILFHMINTIISCVGFIEKKKRKKAKNQINADFTDCSVLDSMYQLLMDLSTAGNSSSTPGTGKTVADGLALTSLACSCLLSLVIARGDTGKLLAAVAVALMSPSQLASQEIIVSLSTVWVIKTTVWLNTVALQGTYLDLF